MFLVYWTLKLINVTLNRPMTIDDRSRSMKWLLFFRYIEIFLFFITLEKSSEFRDVETLTYVLSNYLIRCAVEKMRKFDLRPSSDTQ